MRAGNAFSELSNNKPNSNSNYTTIRTRNNKTSSRIDLEQTDTQKRLDWMEKRKDLDGKATSRNQLTKRPRIVGTEGSTRLGNFRTIAYLVESSRL